MFTKYFTNLSLVTSFGLMLLMGVGYASFGQKEHGNNGHGNGDGGGKQGENRGDRGDNERGNGGDKQDRRRQEPQIFRQEDRGGSDERGNGNWKQERRNERPIYNVPTPQQVPWGGGWIPPGQIRSHNVHERNAERKAIKDQEKAYRRENRDDQRYSARQWFDQTRHTGRNSYTYLDPRSYDPNRQIYRQGVTVDPYGPRAGYSGRPNGYYTDPNSYQYGQDPNYYGYGSDPYSNVYGQYPSQNNGGLSWKKNLLRTLINSILGGVGGGNNAYYDQNAYNSSYAYGPVRDRQSSYYNGAYSPQNAGYDPAYSQYPSYTQPQYFGTSPLSGGLLNSIPLTGLFGQRGGAGGYVAQILSQFLAQGFLQGSLAGQTARQSGLGSRYYNDPYVGANGVYDPYSYTMGENRRILSEGYNLGYEDALSGRYQYNQCATGNVDLVNLLLNNVFQLG